MGLMVYRRRGGKRRRMLEMAPMVDIVFQLLIFFLVATEFRPTEADFRMKLPSPGPPPHIITEPEPEPDVCRVTLTRLDDGTGVEVALDKERLGTMHAEEDEDRLSGGAFAVLGKRLREAAARSDENFMVMVGGSPKVRVKFIAGAVDTAVGAGVPRIAFAKLF